MSTSLPEKIQQLIELLELYAESPEENYSKENVDRIHRKLVVCLRIIEAEAESLYSRAVDAEWAANSVVSQFETDAAVAI